MLKFKKSLVSLLTVASILSGGAVTAFADGVAQKSQDVDLNGTAQATVVSFTVPQSVSFVLNPNGKTADERFVSPEFKISNDCNAPLNVSISKFDNAEDSAHKFTNVAPGKYTEDEWNKLDLSTSMKEIALGMKAVGNEQWRGGTPAKSQIFATDVTGNPVLFGAINPNSSADLKLIANHGNSFTALTSKYVATFIFDLN